MQKNKFVNSLNFFFVLVLISCTTTSKINSPRSRQVANETDEKISLGPLSFKPQDSNTITPKYKSSRAIHLPTNQSELRNTCLIPIAALNASLPEINSEEFIIQHNSLTISYNFFHRNPNWVYHKLNSSNLENGCASRKKGPFDPDPLLKENQIPDGLIVKHNDFSNSGFDRGHMAPSADFLISPEINAETFYTTNITPQTSGLNEKTWEKLETRIRQWACGHEELEIYTGPVLKKTKDELTLDRLASCISVPQEFFKVILSHRNGKLTGIAFLYNQNDGDPKKDIYKERAMTIRQLEDYTGINFFNDKYTPDEQDQFESKPIDWTEWDGTESDCAKRLCSQKN